jgi:hypothetical protein
MFSIHPGADLAVAVVVAAVATAAGARLRRLARVGLRPGLRLPADFVAGCWLLASAVLALGLLHLWNRWTLWAVVIGLAAAGRWRGTGWRWSSLAAPALGSLVALPVALAPPFFYDALVYHLGLPWQGLLEGGLRAHPEDLFSMFPPLAQLLAAVPLSVGCDRAPALLHWVSFIAAAAAAGALARALGAPRWAARLASACVPLLPGLALVPGLPAAEGYALAGVIAAAAITFDARRQPGWPAWAGGLAGAAVACRLQALGVGAFLVAVLTVRAASAWRAGVVAPTAAIVGSAPWWVKNLVLLGAPFAPVGLDREGVATLWRDANVLAVGHEGLLRAAALAAGALLPHLGYLAPLALAAVLTVARGPRRRAVLVVSFAAAALVIWAGTGTLPRFLAPTAAILTAVAAAAAGTGKPGRWAAGLSLGVAAVAGAALGARELAKVGGVSVIATGAAPRFMANDPAGAFAAARRLPAAARVLFVGEPRGFGFPRCFVAPSQHDVSPLRSVLEASPGPREACDLLRRQRFTHILVNWGELGRLAAGYPVAPWRDVAGWRRWNAFVSWLGPPVVEAGPVQIFALPIRGLEQTTEER